MKKCLYCNNEFKPLGFNNHVRYCLLNPEKIEHGRKSINKGKTPWNKGLSSDTIREKIGKEKYYNMVNKFKNPESKPIGKCKDPNKEKERALKISHTMKNNPNSGGIRKGSGRGKSGWYKGFWCDSSWELAWVIYSIEKGIVFSRNKEKFEYIFNGTKKNYTPDFISDGVYQEIKGRRNFESLDEQNKQKILQFTKPLKVLFENDMKHILDYVISKYGKDYIKLYDMENSVSGDKRT